MDFSSIEPNPYTELNDLRINITDLEDSYLSNSELNDYRRIGSYLDPELLKEYCSLIVEESNRLTGHGSFKNSLQLFLTGFDRYNNGYFPTPDLHPGYTFITRPRLNLTESNLRQHPVLNTLASHRPNNIAFMIRMLLDTHLSRGDYILHRPRDDKNVEYMLLSYFRQLQSSSGLIDPTNPFLTPLCNGLSGISGFPDVTIETETTEPDYHSSDFTFARGSELLSRSTELSLEFKDVYGSVILTLLYYWVLYIALQAKGIVIAYPDDIFEQRLNYTVSIYRFLTDSTRRNILWWAKATGCFPKSVPIGSLFNFSQGEYFINSAQSFSIPFTCNKIEINNPYIFEDFNILVSRYKEIDLRNSKNINDKYYDLDALPIGKRGDWNYVGFPIIRMDGSKTRLAWLANTKDLAKAGLDEETVDLSSAEVNFTKLDKKAMELETARRNRLERDIRILKAQQRANPNIYMP